MTDLQILKEIEEELGIEFKKVSLVNELSPSYMNNIAKFSIDRNSNVIKLIITSTKILNLNLIARLENITELTLSRNEIKDISMLKKLKYIKFLDLNHNKISDLSPIKSFFQKEKFFCHLENNPLKFPPQEIVALGREAINEYFKHAEAGTSILEEAKLIIIGEAGSGKTTFAKKIKNPNAAMPKPEDTTLGIDVQHWSFEETKSQSFTAKLWDFGGQDIYHGTHQFFFSDKSLYVLLADTREQKTDFNYWLNTVEQLTGKDSPLVILLNKKQKHTWKIDEYGLKSRFGSVIRKIISVDLSNVSEIPALQKSIKEQITNLPHIGYRLPTSWVKIRQKLNEIDDKFITFSDFRKICKELGINNPNVVKIISKLFSNIGIFTHFSDNFSSLNDIIFLDSNWLTKTIYLLLNSETVEQKKGRISLEEIQEIWKADDLYFEINKFIDLLKKFSLIYRINGSDRYIIPAHLPTAQPYPTWKYAKEDTIYQFRYLFDNYMPKGIMAKLIVELHRYIYDNELAWHRGVNIANSVKNPTTFAEIIETYGRENRFDIRIYGENHKELLQRIIYHFDKILEPFSKLTHIKQVPCNCDTCKAKKVKGTPYFYDYEKLLERRKNGKTTVECDKKPYQDVYINELLEGINDTALRSLLINQKFEAFKELISQRLSDISYQIHKGKVAESFFHGIFHTILAENALKPISEESTNDGRIDLHLTIGETKYLFELKVDATAGEALKQIQEKEYYKKYQRDFKNIVLIGINFSSKKRTIEGIKTVNLIAN